MGLVCGAAVAMPAVQISKVKATHERATRVECTASMAGSAYRQWHGACATFVGRNFDVEDVRCCHVPGQLLRDTEGPLYASVHSRLAIHSCFSPGLTGHVGVRCRSKRVQQRSSRYVALADTVGKPGTHAVQAGRSRNGRTARHTGRAVERTRRYCRDDARRAARWRVNRDRL